MILSKAATPGQKRCVWWASVSRGSRAARAHTHPQIPCISLSRCLFMGWTGSLAWCCAWANERTGSLRCPCCTQGYPSGALFPEVSWRWNKVMWAGITKWGSARRRCAAAVHVSHTGLLIKQVSVLTRKTKWVWKRTSILNGVKAFPSVVAHLFIPVFKLINFSPDWHFSKSSCSPVKVCPSPCSISCCFIHTSGKLISLFFSSVSKCRTPGGLQLWEMGARFLPVGQLDEMILHYELII